MFVRYFIFTILLVFGVTVVATPGGADSTRNRDDAARAAEQARADEKKAAREAKKAEKDALMAQTNRGGFRIHGGMKPAKTRRDLEALKILIGRAIDEAVFADSIYARDIYEVDNHDGLLARGVDGDFDFADYYY